MQAIKTITACLIIGFINYSCGQITKNSQDNTIQLNGKIYTLKEVEPSSNITEPKIIFHKIDDTQRNMVMCYQPIPSDWKYLDKLDEDGAYIKGNNNVRVLMPRNNLFVYSQLPGYNQMMAEVGHQIKPLKSAEQLVKEELTPLFSKDGINLLKQYHLPKLKAYDENYDEMMFTSVPQQKSFEVLSTEWGDNKGNRLLLIIRQYISYTQEACNWGYMVNMLDAPKTYFETAKSNYIYSLENTKYNPQWRYACYMEDAKKAAQAGKLHQQRMANLRAEGQRIIQRGKAHSSMVDANHKRFMDSHLERQTVSTGGANYQVDAGSNVYWINSNGEYIPTNDYNFNPNNDENLNNQSWTKATINN